MLFYYLKQLGLVLLKRKKDYGINPQASHSPFIPFPFLLDRTKPECTPNNYSNLA
jgi:hypothetical protein